MVWYGMAEATQANASHVWYCMMQHTAAHSSTQYGTHTHTQQWWAHAEYRQWWAHAEYRQAIAPMQRQQRGCTGVHRCTSRSTDVQVCTDVLADPQMY